MNILRLVLAPALIGVTLLPACGGAAPTAPASPSAGDPAGTAATATTAAPANTTTAALSPAAKAAKLEEQRTNFTKSCIGALPDAVPAERLAYCNCSWGELRAKVSDVAILADEIPQATEAEVTKASIAKCGPALSDASLKPSFMAGCLKDGAEMRAFCDCTYSAFVKQKVANLATFSDPAQMQAATVISATTCQATFPEAVMRKQIIDGCSGGDAAKVSRCTCVAGAIMKLVPRAKIIAGDSTAMAIAKPEIAKCK
jgi:hypothetical protein